MPERGLRILNNRIDKTGMMIPIVGAFLVSTIL